MTKEDNERNSDYEANADSLRATRKAERRERQRQQSKDGPVVERSGVWTGTGWLREGEGLEKLLAERSLTVDGHGQSRRTKRRSRKKKK